MNVSAEPVTSKRSLIALAVFFLLCLGASLVGNAFTLPNLDWYATLTKPGFTPPNSVFPVVWSILFVMIAIAGWLVWRAPGDAGERQTAMTWFGLQLALNALWPIAFFGMHSPMLGLGVILGLIVAIILTIVYFDKFSRAAALLLVPYLLWVGFATGLNFAIWMLNTAFAPSPAL